MNSNEIYFVSDTHFFHRLMISDRLGERRRPFDSIEQMNETLIKNWNSVVPEVGAHVFHLGDVSFGNGRDTENVLRRLHGQKYLVLGNHDNQPVKKCFTWVKNYYELKVQEPGVLGQRLVLFHYPIGSWHQIHHGSWQLHGHCHGGYRYTRGKQLDVGIDALPGYRPHSYSEIKNLVSNKHYEQVDYHTPKEPVDETGASTEDA